MLGQFLISVILYLAIMGVHYKVNGKLNMRDISFSLFLVSHSYMNSNRNVANILFIIAIAINLLDTYNIVNLKLSKIRE